MPRIDFDPKSVPDSETSYDPIPPGDYTCQVIDSVLNPTKKGDGEILKLTIQVMEGDYTGRLIWHNINMKNPSAKAVEISQQHLKALCFAIGYDDVVPESEMLHNHPFTGRVTIRPDDGKGFGPQNDIKYRPYVMRDGPALPLPAPVPRSPTPPPIPLARKPWANTKPRL